MHFTFLTCLHTFIATFLCKRHLYYKGKEKRDRRTLWNSTESSRVCFCSKISKYTISHVLEVGWLRDVLYSTLPVVLLYNNAVYIDEFHYCL